MMRTSETDQSTMQNNLTNKSTPSGSDLTAGTYNLVPTNHTFSGFLFEGGGGVSWVEFIAKIRMWITWRTAP